MRGPLCEVVRRVDEQDAQRVRDSHLRWGSLSDARGTRGHAGLRGRAGRHGVEDRSWAAAAGDIEP